MLKRGLKNPQGALIQTNTALRTEVDKYDNLYYNHGLKLAAKLELHEKIPRMWETQIHHDNYSFSSAHDLHRVIRASYSI
jgi:hypothetical protein